MRAGARVLAFAGRNGPLLLLLGVGVGIAVPPLARAARPLMEAAVFVFTFGAFLKVDLRSFRAEVAAQGLRRNLLVLGWVVLGVPTVVLGLVALLRPGEDLAAGLLLCALAPPVGSAAAIAAMLGLGAPLALFASVTATLAAPVLMPSLAVMLGGPQLALDSAGMTLRLLLIVGGAGLASAGLRRWAPRFVAGNPAGMTGIAVLALLVFALGAMRGVQEVVLGDPAAARTCLLLAFAANAGLQVLGTLLFLGRGRATALTVGLVSGNRNVGLAWAAAGAGLTPGAELFFAMSVLPIYVLPALSRPVIAALLAPRDEALSPSLDAPRPP